MFPICSWKLSDAYDNVVDRKIFQGFKELKEHCYQHLQNFPFEMNLEHLHLVTHPVKHEKFRMMKNYKSSRLLFLVHKVGIAEGDLHELLKLAVGKSGKYFNGKGMYGQGYYLTSHIEYALNEVFYGETSEFAPNVVDDEDEESKLDDQFGSICCFECVPFLYFISYLFRSLFVLCFLSLFFGCTSLHCANGLK